MCRLSRAQKIVFHDDLTSQIKLFTFHNFVHIKWYEKMRLQIVIVESLLDTDVTIIKQFINLSEKSKESTIHFHVSIHFIQNRISLFIHFHTCIYYDQRKSNKDFEPKRLKKFTFVFKHKQSEILLALLRASSSQLLTNKFVTSLTLPARNNNIQFHPQFASQHLHFPWCVWFQHLW